MLHKFSYTYSCTYFRTVVLDCVRELLLFWLLSHVLEEFPHLIIIDPCVLWTDVLEFFLNISESGEGIWFPLHHAVWNSCSESGWVTRHRVKACKMVDTLKRCDLASQISKSWCSQVLLVTTKWYWGLWMMCWFVLEKVCVLLLWRSKYRTAAFGGSNPWTKLSMEQCESIYVLSNLFQ